MDSEGVDLDSVNVEGQDLRYDDLKCPTSKGWGVVHSDLVDVEWQDLSYDDPNWPTSNWLLPQFDPDLEDGVRLDCGYVEGWPSGSVVAWYGLDLDGP